MPKDSASAVAAKSIRIEIERRAGELRADLERANQATDQARAAQAEQRKATEVAAAERAAKALQGKLDRLDEAFLFERSIDIDTYDRHAEKLRQELTLLRMDRHSSELDELDVEGILAFAERVLPRAADLWVQASLDQRQRFQQLFFPEGIAFDGNGFVGTAVTAPAFNYLRPADVGKEGLVDRTGFEPVSPPVAERAAGSRSPREGGLSTTRRSALVTMMP
mgnify:CR=1 FL=1